MSSYTASDTVMPGIPCLFVAEGVHTHVTLTIALSVSPESGMVRFVALLKDVIWSCC